MYRCDLTGISCEGREVLNIPGNAPLWIASSVKVLLMQGHNILEIKGMLKKMQDDFEAMSLEERLVFFQGSNIKVR